MIYDRFDDARMRQRLKEMRDEIVAKTNKIKDGWITLKLEAKQGHKAREIKVARIPFERWAFSASNHREQEWKNVAPFGLKLHMDDPNHSDWWLSSGVHLGYSYVNEWDLEKEVKAGRKLNKNVILAGRLNQAAWRWKSDRMTKDGWMWLIKPTRKIEGRVQYARNAKEIAEFAEEAQSWKKASNSMDLIAVIPQASSEFDLLVRHAAAIITAQGSKVAHLVMIAREDNVPVILCEKAFETFYNWEPLKIDKDHIFNSR